MERKIGEIFEYNGEWHQCLEGNSHRCDYCDYLDDCNKIACASDERSDDKEVYFKKLEKVGVPYISSRNKKRYQLCRCFCLPIITKDKRIEIGDANFVGIEVKQNKEDMKEKKVKISKEDATYLLNELHYILDERLSGEGSDKVMDDIIQILDIEQPNLKPFNLEEAKAGKPVCTRDGRKARIICFDRKSETPITVLVTEINGIEVVYSYPNNGIWDSSENTNGCDLMMLPEKKEMWLNIYKGTTGPVPGGCLYDTEEDAKDAVKGDENYVTTVKVCWEE